MYPDTKFGRTTVRGTPTKELFYHIPLVLTDGERVLRFKLTERL